jgi:ribonuclease P/MRP protein subunit POP3
MLTHSSLIAPLGDHRRNHIQPSKSRKRKRKSKEHEDDAPPPAPEVGKHILVGINAITRHLEALAARTVPSTFPDLVPSLGNAQPPRPLSVILLTHPKPSTSPAHAHFPTLLHLSNLQSPTPQATRLIPLSTSTDARLASTLHIPRVGALAVFADAPGAKALEAFVRQNVDVTTCAWIDEAADVKWSGVNVTSGVSTEKEKVGIVRDSKASKE